jgi:hypothetical protein
MYRAAGSFRRSLPRSTSFITADVVAIGFVNEARSKIVSTVIGSRCGISIREPKALR